MAQDPRPLFDYGTLCANPLLAWAVTGDAKNTDQVKGMATPATVTGYARYSIHNMDFPGVIEQEGSMIDGLLLRLYTRSQRKKLDDYEGEMYKVTAVKVTTEEGEEVEADMYVWNGDMGDLSGEGWELERFVEERLQDWLDIFEGMELVGDDDE